VRILAFYLEQVRTEIGLSLHVAVNGGYRSPAHKLGLGATPHMWGTAVDVYRVGTTILKDQETIEKYNQIAENVSDEFYVMPYGHEPGTADDHMHIDLGYVTLLPREVSEDRMEIPQEQPRFAFEERRQVGERRRRDGDEERSSRNGEK
jgi:hypothetical protein